MTLSGDRKIRLTRKLADYIDRYLVDDHEIPNERKSRLEKLSIFVGRPAAPRVTLRPNTDTELPDTRTGVKGATMSSSRAILESNHLRRESLQGSSSPLASATVSSTRRTSLTALSSVPRACTVMLAR